MSGAVAAHAAHNGSGTQGLAVTHKVTDTDGDVQSVFWNANNTTRHLVYGSAFVEIPANAGSGTSTAGSPITQVFDVNNDIDCLGDIVLKVEITGNGTGINPLQIASLIDRVEMQVGTQIWQTLEKADLLALASTELSSGSFSDFALHASGGVTDRGEYTDIPGSQVAASLGKFVSETNGFVAFLPLKMFTKTLGPNLENFAEQTETGYLMAAAPHQQVKIKVVTKAITMSSGSGHGIKNDDVVNLSLFAKSQVMCNEEREALKAMPQGVPKRIKMSQHATKTYASGNMELDLDHFSLYASHILITIPLNVVGNGLEQVEPEAELLLNSSSFSGKLPLGLLRMTGSSIGLYTNSYTTNNTDTAGTAVYVFPLAARVYSGSSVPLNRFDNIRLKLTGLASGPSGDVDVTCVGETTALYKNGAASLAMY